MFKKYDILNKKVKNIEYPRVTPDFSKKIEEAEDRLAQYLKVKHTVIVNNRSSALYLALKSLDMVETTEIIVPSIEYKYVPIVCEYSGFKIGFADIEENSNTISPDSLKERISGKSGAVIVSNLFGHPTFMNDIKNFTKANHLKLIELGRDGLGGIYRGTKVGSHGDISIVGFYYVNGGAIVTNDSIVREKLLNMRNCGINTISGEIETPSLSFMPDYYQVMEINKLLKDVDDYLETRYSIVKSYIDVLSELSHVILPANILTATHTYEKLIIKISNVSIREKVLKYVKSINFEGIPDVFLLPQLNRYKKIYHQNVNFFKNGREFMNSSICLPLDIPRGSEIPEEIAKIIKG